MNAAKSKYNTGPAPKSSTTKIEAAGAGVKYTVDQVNGDGTALHWEFTGKCVAPRLMPHVGLTANSEAHLDDGRCNGGEDEVQRCHL
jgi:hypothetical protein